MVDSLVSTRRRALVMGVLNRTPDSFSDGGDFVDDGLAIARAEQMLDEGADIIDVGAESTRPGALAIDAATQLARLGQVIAHLAKRGVTCSIDTTSLDVAEQALAQGAQIVNLVDPSRTRAMARAAKRAGADLVIMHARGAMKDMPGFSAWPDDDYRDVVTDVARELGEAARVALDEGLDPRAVCLDPGLGFSKNALQSLTLCARLDEIVALGHPVLVGASRKSFLAKVVTDVDAELPGPGERLAAGLVAHVACVDRGAVVVRTHDVAPTVQALAMARALASTAPRRVARAADAEVARA